MSAWRLIVGDCVEVLRGMPESSIDAIATDPPYGLGFMGKAWDDLPPGVEWATACLRVLKPGSHLVAFGGTRTVHRLACALEDAGFEIRDTIAWVQWQGFPKSLDVSKAIDKAAGAKREVVGTGLSGGGRRAMNDAPGNGRAKDYLAGPYDVTAPATDAAKQWAGWGTALKPAHEPAILARKPLVGTVAENVLRYGTGALNIDACRYAYGDSAWPGPDRDADEINRMVQPNLKGADRPALVDYAPAKYSLLPAAHPLGRFPANLYHCPKPDRGERDEGCEDLPQYVKAQLAGAGGGGLDPVSERFRSKPMGNVHPTVKPLTLMRWLCRLVTPPGGVVLDPFAGSGTTLVAALRENFRVIGIEKDEGYAEIAKARVSGRDGPLFRACAG